jgi:hypothetical protein
VIIRTNDVARNNTKCVSDIDSPHICLGKINKRIWRHLQKCENK